MKKILFILSLFVFLFAAGCATSEMSSNDYGPDQTFSMLNDYGHWIFVPGLGRVWKPAEPVDWQPYSDGYWQWTNMGWLWVSDEEFGWIVYHYGYWDFDNQYGWLWIPSYDWVPARVDWFYQDGYIGWAPRPSSYFAERNTYFESNANRVYVFVKQQNFLNDNVVRYRTNSNEINVRTLRDQNGGRAPDIRDVEHATNRQIETRQINEERVNAGNRQLIRARVEGNRSNIPVRNNSLRNSSDQPGPIPTAPPPSVNRPPAGSAVNPPPPGKEPTAPSTNNGNKPPTPKPSETPRKPVKETPPKNNVRSSGSERQDQNNVRNEGRKGNEIKPNPANSIRKPVPEKKKEPVNKKETKRDTTIQKERKR